MFVRKLPVHKDGKEQGYWSLVIRRSRHLSFSSDAPVMVSVLDSEEKIQQLLPHRDQTVHEGLIAISEVEIIQYVHQDGARILMIHLVHSQHSELASGSSALGRIKFALHDLGMREPLDNAWIRD